MRLINYATVPGMLTLFLTSVELVVLRLMGLQPPDLGWLLGGALIVVVRALAAAITISNSKSRRAEVEASARPTTRIPY
jgi:hypothetical protein